METNVGTKISFYRKRKNMMRESEVIFDDDFRGYSKIRDGNDNDNSSKNGLIKREFNKLKKNIHIIM